MKNFKVIIVVYFFLFSLSSFNLNAQSDLLGLAGEETLNRIENDLGNLMKDALRRSDIMVMQRIDQLNLLINNLRIDFSKELKSTLREADRSVQNVILSLDDLARMSYEEIHGAVKDLDLLIANNLENLCYNLSAILCPDAKVIQTIKGIDGINQSYSKNIKFYALQVYGTLMNSADSDRNMYALIKNKIFKWSVPMGHHNPNKVQFNINSDFLNPLFEDTSIVRIPMEIIVEKRKGKLKTFFAKLFGKKDFVTHKFPSAIYLLPKYPVKYELYEYRRDKEWRECKDCFKPVVQVNTGLSYLTTISIDFGRHEKFESFKIEPEYGHTPSKYDAYYFSCDEGTFVNEGTRLEINCIHGFIPHKNGVELQHFDDAFHNRNGLNRQLLYTVRDNVIINGIPIGGRINTSPKDIQVRVKYKKQADQKEITKELKKVQPNVLSDELISKGYLAYGTFYSDYFKSMDSEYRMRIWPSWGEYSNRDVFLDKNTRSFEKILNLAAVRVSDASLLGEKQIKIEVETSN